MYGVIPAGGCTTRPRPITRYGPQMRLPVGGQTVIDRILTRLEGDDRSVNCHGTAEQVALADGLIGAHGRLPAGEPSR